MKSNQQAKHSTDDVLMINFSVDNDQEKNYEQLSSFTNFNITLINYEELENNYDFRKINNFFAIFWAIKDFNDIIKYRNFGKLLSNLSLTNHTILTILKPENFSLRIAALQVKDTFCIFGNLTSYELYLYLNKCKELLLKNDTIYREFIIDVSNRLITVNKKSIKISQSILKLLMLLSEKPYCVHSREELYPALFNTEWDPIERKLDVLINRSRKIFFRHNRIRIGRIKFNKN